MSFRPPKPPRLATASTPSRSTFVPVTETPIRPVYGTGAVLTPQVDLVTTTDAFAQLKPFRKQDKSRSGSPRSSSPHKNKRLIQHKHWTQLIASSIPTYLNLLKGSDNLRSIPRSLTKNCSCHVNVRKLEIVLVSFDSIETAWICSCNPMSFLIASGFFPSSPIRPTVAFDMKMLELARELYLRSPPNRTAWSLAWEAFLRGRGYTFGHPDFLRRKFTVAIRYYCLLQAETQMHVRKAVLMLQSIAASGREPSLDDRDPEWVDVDELVAAEYLAQACGLCFGLVWLSALMPTSPINGSSLRGDLVMTPQSDILASIFISDEEIQAARALVEKARAKRPSRGNQTARSDTVEPGMKVSEATLDGCSDSFTAADEKRVKANSTFFADTGLMALLCRHDRVLWLANMTTPGERQFYAIALIIKLFQALPKHVTVGILYDIGCQLHRSCVKWDFIPEYADRIIWGISIFHAYGHQWPCQLVYHPRKCIGFGLSDGEGCERFWSSIQDVIGPLRVSGYHQRLFTLDLQVEFLHEMGLYDLGDWLVRKSRVCAKRKSEAEVVLVRSVRTRDEIRAFWANQVEVQTRPLTSATTNLAKLAVERIMLLTSYCKKIADDITTLDQDVASGNQESLIDAGDKRDKLVAQKLRIEKEIAQKRRELGIAERAQLQRAKESKYIQLRMQARALKERIREKLRYRRFELERLDRVHNRPSASERHLHSHVGGSTTSHEPSIYTNVAKFNNLCDQMEDLIRKRKAPRTATPPLRLNRDTIFYLDVDDPVWSDAGLGEDDMIAAPLWLTDNTLRQEIQALLMVDRCTEEECYLIRESVYLHAWFVQEWHGVALAIEMSDDESIAAYLQRYQSKLLYLGAIWSSALEKARLVDDSLDWGPSKQQFSSAIDAWWGKKVADDSSSSAGSSTDSDDWQDEISLDNPDWSLFEGMEVDEDGDRDYLGIQDGFSSDQMVEEGSPRKRLRTLSD